MRRESEKERRDKRIQKKKKSKYTGSSEHGIYLKNAKELR